MPAATTRSVTLTGTHAHLITINAEVSDRPPATVITGLPETCLRETRDRIRAAILNSGEHWPDTEITISLSPASRPGHGSALDLAIAIAVIAANGELPALPGNLAFLAELGLDGRLRPVPGTLPAVLAAAEAEVRTVVVAAGNHAEASLVPEVTVISADSLAEILGWLRGGPAPQTRTPAPGDDDSPTVPGELPDLRDVPGQTTARHALEVCAAGGHHLSLLGPPEAGKTMLAERLPGILPPLDVAAATEVTAIHSVAGHLGTGSALMTVPPFSAPHHTASLAAIIGGGIGVIRPGAASLAHRGVLYLDDAPEFNRDVLDALRQPLETGQVVIARADVQAVFPARFTLVLAANPCPCARVTGPGNAGCSCSPSARRRYLARISGPLLDQVDVKARLQPISRRDMLAGRASAESSAVVAARVIAARERGAARLTGTPWRVNAEVPGSALRREFMPGPGALAALDRATELGQVSARGADKVVRVAWTLADLNGNDQPSADDISQALCMWLGTAPAGR